MKSIEEKIIKLKEKLDSKWVEVISFFVVGLVIVFAMEMLSKYKIKKQEVEDRYNKAMYEAYGYINNVKNEFAKLEIANSKILVVTTLQSIYEKAALAKIEIMNLPLEQNKLSSTSKFLTQLSDYAYSLSKQQLQSEELVTKDQKDNISYIYSKIDELSDVMIKIYNRLNSNEIKWDELRKIGDNEFADIDVNEGIKDIAEIGKIFQKYDGLIYDGAFSEHILNSKPKSLSDNECSEHEAKEYIINLFGNENIENIEYKGDSSGTIDLYEFDVKLKNSSFVRNIYITKNDCKLYLMVGDRDVIDENLTINEAKIKGREFLEKLGIEDEIEDTYYLKVENMAIINYAIIQDSVICYPDLIKVKIALDTGEVCSVESEGYIFNNHKRENLVPRKTIEEARNVIGENIKVLSEKLAIIPTDSKDEILAYEFKGIIEDREFLVYINANTLNEERVLVIIETPGGLLTM